MGEKMQESWKSMNFYGKIVNPSYLKELFISAKINSISIETSWKSIERRRHKDTDRILAKVTQLVFNLEMMQVNCSSKYNNCDGIIC